MPVGGCRVIDTTRHRGQSTLVQNNIDIFHCGTGDVRVTHIGLEKINLVYNGGEVGLFACEKIVDNPYEAALRDKPFADIRADEAGSAGH